MKTPRTRQLSAMTRSALLAAFFFGSFFVYPSSTTKAQVGWDITLRPAINLPVADFGGSKLITGVGLEGAFSYRFMPFTTVFIGYSWNGFSADTSFAGPMVSIAETGYSFGMQYIHPIGTTAFSYFVSAAAILNHIEIENEGGNLIGDSRHGLGWQAGAGIAFAFGERFTLTPGVRYRSLSRDILVGDSTTAVHLQYVSLGIGVTWAF